MAYGLFMRVRCVTVVWMEFWTTVGGYFTRGAAWRTGGDGAWRDPDNAPAGAACADGTTCARAVNGGRAENDSI